MVIRAASRIVLDCGKPLRVVEDGTLIGVVGPEEILRIVPREPGESFR